MSSLPILFAVMLLPGACMLATSIIVSLFEQSDDSAVSQEHQLNTKML